MKPNTIKSIAVCVDDFALYAGIDEAVCELVNDGAVASFSVMSTAPRWLRESAPLAAQLTRPHEVGLHLNFTHRFSGFPEVFDLKQLILRAYLHQLSREKIRASIEQQFDLLVAGLGRLPDFIDGHQHVHQLPMIRTILLDVVQRRYVGVKKPWIRSTLPNTPHANLKSRVIAGLGAKTFARALVGQGLGFNRQFFGAYSFAKNEQNRFQTALPQWLTDASSGALLMCHPCASSNNDDDPIASQRVQEYRFLRSPAYRRLREEMVIEVVPLGRILNLCGA